MKSAEFYNREQYELNVQHSLYSIDEGKLYDQQNIIVLRDGRNYYANSYGIEKIRTSDYQVVVNHIARIVLISNLKDASGKDKEQQQDFQSDIWQVFSMMLESTSGTPGDQNASQYLGVKGNNHLYHISFSGGAYEGADFYFDKSTWMLQKSVYFFRDKVKVGPGVWDKAKLVILPTKFKTDGSVDKKKFSTDAIFRVGNDGKFVLTDSYSGYTPIVE